MTQWLDHPISQSLGQITSLGGILIDYRNLVIPPQQIGVVIPAVRILNQGVKANTSVAARSNPMRIALSVGQVRKPPTSTSVPKFLRSLF